MVKNVLEKLDTILDEPSKSCGDFIDKALQAIEHKCPKDAKVYFDKAVENAVKGKLLYEIFHELSIFIFIKHPTYWGQKVFLLVLSNKHF